MRTTACARRPALGSPQTRKHAHTDAPASPPLPSEKVSQAASRLCMIWAAVWLLASATLMYCTTNWQVWQPSLGGAPPVPRSAGCSTGCSSPRRLSTPSPRGCVAALALAPCILSRRRYCWLLDSTRQSSPFPAATPESSVQCRRGSDEVSSHAGTILFYAAPHSGVAVAPAAHVCFPHPPTP